MRAHYVRAVYAAAVNASGSPTRFDRVLVGVDGSPESQEAARQAAVLTEPGGTLTLLAVYDIAPAIVGGTGSETPSYYDEDVQRERAEAALESARDAVPAGMKLVEKVVRGNAADELVRELSGERQTLVAVGSHGTGRVRGIVVGSTATAMIHRAPACVLVARKSGDEFPKRIVVGLDAEGQSADASATAEHLAERFGTEPRSVVAEQESPVDTLVREAGEADLLVLGSRGLHGLRSLRSVSERVAHRAQCSVLIVREAGEHA
jgi:nucleotide-binding universal stress UspA family protein